MSGPHARLGWEPRDLWVGVYWDLDWLPGAVATRRFRVYVCCLPCLPLRLTWTWGGHP